MLAISQWVKTWCDLGVGDSPALRRLHGDVLGRYSEPHRHYHTYQHLAECFENVQEIISLADHPAEVNVGLWFHDVIYETQRHDNEERSADWARSAAREFGASAESAQRIYDLIMFTRHAADPIGIDAKFSSTQTCPSWVLSLRGSRNMKRRFGASMDGFQRQCSAPLGPRY